MKFVDVTNDIAFRKIFGNENKKTALISFLNAVLGFVGNDIIEDVTIKNPYQLSQYSGGKSTIVDVKATDKNGNTFIVEMQIADLKDFDKRVLYYASQSFTDQIVRGDLYPNLKPIYFIGILDFNATQNSNYLTRHKILDTLTGENVIKDFEFNFIELQKFNKEAGDLISIIDQWTYFIKNAENLEVVPDSITDEGLKDAFEQANKHNWTAQELEDYNKVFIREQDERGRLELAEDRGIQKGIQKNKIDMYELMNAAGEPVEKIMSYTGLTKGEIDKLRKTE
jgi:predicted transposase/invertase (TIGR01784 family)